MARNTTQETTQETQYTAAPKGGSPYLESESKGGNQFIIESETAGLPLFRPDRMLESLRFAEYDLEHAIGELVDNSVEGGAHHVWVRHTRHPLVQGNKTYNVVSTVAVIDDGEGMDAEVLGRALVLGDSPRPKRGTSLGIGRFGVGMTLGALSLARRIDVYSRDDKSKPFLYTYLDLDEVGTKVQTGIPTPVVRELPETYADLLKGSTGTLVLLSRCDRLQRSQVNDDRPIAADELVSGLANWLGRTYRKFIANGLEIELDGDRVYLHDPLYAAGPTVWDTKVKGGDPKAKVFATEYITLDVPGEEGKTADVAVTMSLLPEEFRSERFAGGRGPAKERRINENEGVSILRADREVLYGKVPYLQPGVQERGREHDRFWSCEISFPPELDPYFEVRYIKRGAEPTPALRKQLRALITPTIKSLRTQIMSDWKLAAEEEEAQKTAYATAEEAFAAADQTLPRNRRGTNITEADANRVVDDVVEESTTVVDASSDERSERKEAEKQRVTKRPYAIVPVRFPSNVLFETAYLPGRIIVRLNTMHPFYKRIFEPLCGPVDAMTEDSDTTMGTTSPEQRRARDGFMLLLLAFAKAQALFGDDIIENVTPEQIFGTLQTQWGVTLAAAVNKLPEY
ncbi:MAG: ATP-binding protein [Gemmatimonadaceae bacterium]